MLILLSIRFLTFPACLERLCNFGVGGFRISSLGVFDVLVVQSFGFEV